MSFEHYLREFLTAARANLPVAVGGGVAIVVLTVLFVRHYRGRGEAAPAAPGPLGEEQALNWAPPEQSYADRRGSVRREGAPVPVTLSSPSFRGGVNDGFVTDRSTGGLRIVLRAAVAPGSTLQVRAVNAPDTVSFISVLVRSCRKSGEFYELGCEFEKTPPWNVLLLFG